MVNRNCFVNEEQEKNWVMSWIDNSCPDVPTHRAWYKIACFLAGRRKKKLTYKEIYIILCNINRKKGDAQKDVQRNAIEQIIMIYSWNEEHENDKG